MGIYGAKLVATNSRVKTVHILATTTVRGEVTTHPRTACGLTGYRPASTEQVAIAARCDECTSHVTNEHAANWETRFGGDLMSTWAKLLTDSEVAAMPRRERSWFSSLRVDGFIPAFDRDAAWEAMHRFIESWSGTKRTGVKGDKVTIRARVTRVREVEGSTEGKKGKPRPVQRVLELEGVGADLGAQWITTTRSVAAGKLAIGQEVTVTATLYCVHYQGVGLGETVTNATFRAAA